MLSVDRKIPPSGLLFEWETYWNGGHSGWYFPVSIEHQWVVLFISIGAFIKDMTEVVHEFIDHPMYTGEFQIIFSVSTQK